MKWSLLDRYEQENYVLGNNASNQHVDNNHDIQGSCRKTQIGSIAPCNKGSPVINARTEGRPRNGREARGKIRDMGRRKLENNERHMRETKRKPITSFVKISRPPVLNRRTGDLLVHKRIQNENNLPVEIHSTTLYDHVTFNGKIVAIREYLTTVFSSWVKFTSSDARFICW